eukprot:GHVN01065177.1.p1 GENE.GHVN01065177.1~~GHVN01065177.1.p1  ORF type:complete len:431 (+),score=61.21 GHVN01065177.1:38-1330(+)
MPRLYNIIILAAAIAVVVRASESDGASNVKQEGTPIDTSDEVAATALSASQVEVSGSHKIRTLIGRAGASLKGKSFDTAAGQKENGLPTPDAYDMDVKYKNEWQRRSAEPAPPTPEVQYTPDYLYWHNYYTTGKAAGQVRRLDMDVEYKNKWMSAEPAPPTPDVQYTPDYSYWHNYYTTGKAAGQQPRQLRVMNASWMPKARSPLSAYDMDVEYKNLVQPLGVAPGPPLSAYDVDVEYKNKVQPMSASPGPPLSAYDMDVEYKNKVQAMGVAPGPPLSAYDSDVEYKNKVQPMGVAPRPPLSAYDMHVEYKNKMHPMSVSPEPPLSAYDMDVEYKNKVQPIGVAPALPLSAYDKDLEYKKMVQPIGVAPGPPPSAYDLDVEYKNEVQPMGVESAPDYFNWSNYYTGGRAAGQPWIQLESNPTAHFLGPKK